MRFSIFGLGNSSYPKFCSFGKFLDNTLNYLGAERLFELGIGDELDGQEESFRGWSIDVYKAALKAFCIDTDNAIIANLPKDESHWSPLNYRLVSDDSEICFDMCASLSKLHSRKVLPCKFLKKQTLADTLGRKTVCIALSSQEHIGDFEYRAGDHIGVYAENRKELIDKILAKLVESPDPDQLIRLETLKEKTTVFGEQTKKGQQLKGKMQSLEKLWLRIFLTKNIKITTRKTKSTLQSRSGNQ